MTALPFRISTTGGTVLARLLLAAHVPSFCASVLEAHGELRVHCDVNWLDAADPFTDDGEMDFVVTAGLFGEPVFMRASVAAMELIPSMA